VLWYYLSLWINYLITNIVLLTTKLKSSIFWDITPCSPLKINHCSGRTYHRHLQGRRISRAINQHENRCLCSPPAFMLVSCSAYSLTLKMEVICSSKTLVEFQQNIPHYIPEDSTLHNHRCENLKSFINNKTLYTLQFYNGTRSKKRSHQ
jgi:hypothetical protein